MPKPLVYEVLPSNGGWVVRVASDSQSEMYEDKAVAVSRARRLAARENAFVHVLDANGGLEAEYVPPRTGART